MNTPEANAPAVWLDEMAVLHPDETGLPRGCIEQERYIGRRGSGAAMIHHEGLEKPVIPLSEGDSGKEED
jgi:hypothetical protein